MTGTCPVCKSETEFDPEYRIRDIVIWEYCPVCGWREYSHTEDA
jgi:hypothetical protein